MNKTTSSLSKRRTLTNPSVIIGITSREDLKRLGVVEAYLLVKAHGFKASLNLLYALEAGLQVVPWRALSPQTKAKLKKSL